MNQPAPREITAEQALDIAKQAESLCEAQQRYLQHFIAAVKRHEDAMSKQIFFGVNPEDPSSC